MKRLILITGDLATGKSTLATLLSRRYGIVAVYKDKIKEILGDMVGFQNREENLRLSAATMELMIYSFSEVATLGKDLILEANFKQEEIARLYALAEEKGYEMLTLLLSADIDLLYERFMNRIKNENRHPVHISGFNGYDDFKKYIENGRKNSTYGKVIKIDANDFSYQSDEGLLEAIDNFMEKRDEGN